MIPVDTCAEWAEAGRAREEKHSDGSDKVAAVLPSQRSQRELSHTEVLRVYQRVYNNKKYIIIAERTSTVFIKEGRRNQHNFQHDVYV